MSAEMPPDDKVKETIINLMADMLRVKAETTALRIAISSALAEQRGQTVGEWFEMIDQLSKSTHAELLEDMEEKTPWLAALLDKRKSDEVDSGE